ncbi:hypothetical protein F5ESL0236_05560 [Lactobacillus sp. ESL0236]|uniref:SLAP domain-containing protein n=1 Tax=unclassified Lactobacillus TaxID=2620435 RepID=UPI000EFC74E6|nr:MULTISPECIES: SLAP domain-containing protein [unclassified Lactobacillus]RMC38405.1 hypothetical protein F5ESL0237_05550 [Lactobacillus sp. ESL0237]RMC43213.1 hypothetical protein F5ESL0234_05555 [Lactobacillus sp. ESL0234]RMC44240.1 hypothetical protein F5ESL0236_05560 [Lactobacillus sp. ESL0236]
MKNNKHHKALLSVLATASLGSSLFLSPIVLRASVVKSSSPITISTTKRVKVIKQTHVYNKKGHKLKKVLKKVLKKGAIIKVTVVKKIKGRKYYYVPALKKYVPVKNVEIKKYKLPTKITSPKPNKPVDETKPNTPTDEPKPNKPADETKPNTPTDEPKPNKPADETKPNTPTDEPKPNRPADEPKPNRPADEPKPNKPTDEPKPNKPADETKPNTPTDETKPNKPADEPKPNKPTDETKPNKPEDEPKPNKPEDESKPNKPADEPKPNKPADENKPTSKPSTIADFSLTEFRQEFLKVLNKERVLRGLNPVSEDAYCDQVVQNRTHLLPTNFSHYDEHGGFILNNYFDQAKIKRHNTEECIAMFPWGWTVNHDNNKLIPLATGTSAQVAANMIYEYIYDDADSNWIHRDILLKPNDKTIGIGAVTVTAKGQVYSAIGVIY